MLKKGNMVRYLRRKETLGIVLEDQTPDASLLLVCWVGQNMVHRFYEAVENLRLIKDNEA